jgi:hypothetical protein
MARYDLDHLTLGVRHLYAGCERLRRDHGLVSHEGGWQHAIPTAHRTIVLPGDAYLNVESVIDHQAPLPPPLDAFRRWFTDATRDGDSWMTWCLRTRTHDDLEAVARRFGSEVVTRDGVVRPDGSAVTSVMAPATIHPTWARGLPNWYFHADLAEHPSRRHPPGHHRPLARVAWLEVGGDPAELEDHIGPETFAALPLRFVDRPAGLHGLGLTTDDGDEIALRAPSAAPALATIAHELA